MSLLRKPNRKRAICRKVFFTVAFFTIFSLAGCGGDATDLQKRQMNLSNILSGVYEGNTINEFLSLQSKFGTDQGGDICCDITPQYIKENSAYCIFKYESSCASFLLYDQEIFPMGEWLGGMGVTDAKIADLDGDSEMELYFTFSWGSGVHRSQAGYFHPQLRRVVLFDYGNFDGEMMIIAKDDGGLSLYQAEISQMESPVNFTIEADARITDIIMDDQGLVRIEDV